MRRLALVLAVTLAAGSALAQAPAPGPAIPVPFTDQERQVMLGMCAAATWAQRQQFDGICDYLKNKFDAAVKADADRAKAAEPEKKD